MKRAKSRPSIEMFARMTEILSLARSEVRRREIPRESRIRHALDRVAALIMLAHREPGFN